jgi:hypothetical protein
VNTEGLPLEEIHYVIFLLEFGLTPPQVDELPLKMVELLSPIKMILKGGDESA